MCSVKHSLVDLSDFYILSRFYDIKRKRELRDEPDKNMEIKAVKKMKLDESDSTCKKMASSPEDDVRKEGRLPNSWRRPETIELLGDFAHFTRGHFSFEAIFQRERESKTPSFDYSEYRQFDSPTEPIITTAAEMVNCRVYPIRIPVEFCDENVVVVVDDDRLPVEVEDSNPVECCRQENVLNKDDDVTEDIDVGAEDYYVNVDDDIDKYAYEDVNIDDVYNIGVPDRANEDGTINEDVIISEDVDKMVTDDARISSTEPHEEATAHKDGKSTSPTSENMAPETSPPRTNSPLKSSTLTSSPDVNKSTTSKQKPSQPSYQKTIPSLITSGFTNNFDQKRINAFNNPSINYFNDRSANRGTRMPLFLPPNRPMNFNPFHQLLPLFAISTNSSRTDFGHLHRSSETPSSKKSSTIKNIRMEVCSHYLEGRCKFGARCLKVHPY